jgi:nucleoid-associated protein Lsr2
LAFDHCTYWRDNFSRQIAFSLNVRSRFSVPELTLSGFRRTIRVMAKTVITQITDDLDGSSGAETITFGYRGTNYEIDLGRRNANAFDKTMRPYVDAARKVTTARGGRRGSSDGRRTTRRSSAGQLASIREWARAQGYSVSDRGRISANVMEAYEKAN